MPLVRSSNSRSRPNATAFGLRHRLFADDDAGARQLLDYGQQVAIADPGRAAEHHRCAYPTRSLPAWLPLDQEVADALDQPLEHVPPEERLVALNGADGDGEVEVRPRTAARPREGRSRDATRWASARWAGVRRIGDSRVNADSSHRSTDRRSQVRILSGTLRQAPLSRPPGCRSPLQSCQSTAASEWPSDEPLAYPSLSAQGSRRDHRRCCSTPQPRRPGHGGRASTPSTPAP